MGDSFVYSMSNLEQFTYRYLQQLAKSMGLPSNVKKVYLVEMINAKKCGSKSDVERIVHRVKLARQQLTHGKKRGRRTIIRADSSSSGSLSPPISITPKRPSLTVRCSDLREQIIGRTVGRAQNSLLKSNATKPVPSDRVLRSCNVKTVQRPFMHKFLEVQRNEIELVDQGTQMHTMRVVNKYKSNILGSSQAKDRQMVPVTQIGSTQILVKRQRLLSGVYPITKQLVQVGGVGVRDREGKMASLNAFVHKPREEKREITYTSSSAVSRSRELTLQDIINGNVEAHAARLASNNTGTPHRPDYTELTPESSSTVYYHKKIRAEQVRERRMSAINTRCELPRINEAFGRFHGLQGRDVTQPLYVHVGNEAERTLYPQLAMRNTCLLETVYNFKSHFLTSQPLLQIATTAATKCVYSAPTVATAVPHRPATGSYTDPYTASYGWANHYGDAASSRVNDCLKFADEEYDFRCHEEQKTSGSSIGTVQSQELGANVTISDMVEDALELISQDGDYMERMGMDVRMQCVLCNWAGPKIILEYHIRKEHSNEIDRQEKREWNISYTLGSIVSQQAQQLWQSRIVEHECSLYVLSVKYEPPGCFMATLSSLSSDPELTTGSITMFNKVTGEPFSWVGPIQELPPSLPYDTQPGLNLDLATLDLLPNSANLKFVNGELVLKSPTKVVFGQLELNDIHIILFVKVSGQEEMF